jgi:hypothetical protein
MHAIKSPVFFNCSQHSNNLKIPASTNPHFTSTSKRTATTPKFFPLCLHQKKKKTLGRKKKMQAAQAKVTPGSLEALQLFQEDGSLREHQNVIQAPKMPGCDPKRMAASGGSCVLPRDGIKMEQHLQAKVMSNTKPSHRMDAQINHFLMQQPAPPAPSFAPTHVQNLQKEQYRHSNKMLYDAAPTAAPSNLSTGRNGGPTAFTSLNESFGDQVQYQQDLPTHQSQRTRNAYIENAQIARPDVGAAKPKSQPIKTKGGVTAQGATPMSSRLMEREKQAQHHWDFSSELYKSKKPTPKPVQFKDETGKRKMLTTPVTVLQRQ